jgi:hypothetical protein
LLSPPLSIGRDALEFALDTGRAAMSGADPARQLDAAVLA